MRIFFLKIQLLIFLWQIIFSYNVFSGEIISALSCKQKDVQLAIDSANHGDIVFIPEGICVWNSPKYNEESVSIKKSITLIGAGIDKTIIIDETGNHSKAIPLSIHDMEFLRISSLTFQNMRKTNYAEPAIIARGKFRIDHCKFHPNLESGSPGRGIWIANGNGVIDHCIFIDCKQGIAIFGDGAESWENIIELGTENAVYVEDCFFDNSDDLDGALDAYDGARYVFRKNIINNTKIGHHGTDSGNYRSTHSFEIYENKFYNFKVQNMARLIHLRGGTGVVYNNNVFTSDIGSFTSLFSVSNYRSNCDLHPCSDWGECDGKNPLDGNLDEFGYPCLDQIGRTSDIDNNGIQDRQPLIVWGNTINGELFEAEISGDATKHIKEGRDLINNYNLNNDPEKISYESFEYPHPLTKPKNAKINIR